MDKYVTVLPLYKGVIMDNMSTPNSRTIYNQYVHRLARDAELLLEALNRVKIADSSTSDDDDMVELDGKKYYYHPPDIDDRVQVLWKLTPTVGSDVSNVFFKGTIQKIIKTKGKIRYVINYDDDTVAEDFLNIADFPKKWNFVTTDL